MMKKQSNTSMSIPPPNNKKIKNHQLPTEIISEIFSRLSIKTLFHCLLVCKNWLSLISSNPHFAYLHLSRSPINLLMKPINLLIKPINRNQLRLIDLQMIRHKKGYPQETQLKLIPNINFPLLGSQILNSCNGLLCLLGSSEIFVCNPILGQYIVFLYPNDGIFDKRILAFGFSFKTNQYKVILFYYDDDDGGGGGGGFKTNQYTSSREEVYAKIYTIGEGCWRDLGRVPFYLKNRYFNSFLNGALHWLNFTPDPAAADPDFIQCFDFESEQFRVVPGPPEFGLHDEEVVGSNQMQLGVLQESLSLCDFSSHAHIDIWIMRYYGIKESWTKMFSIENVNVGNKWGNLGSYEPIMILNSGNVLMLCNNDVLVLYNPKLGSSKKQNIYGIKLEFQATAHIPTLVSLQDFARAERVVSFDMLLKNKGCRDYHFLEALLGSRTSFQKSIEGSRKSLTLEKSKSSESSSGRKRDFYLASICHSISEIAACAKKRVLIMEQKAVTKQKSVSRSVKNLQLEKEYDERKREEECMSILNKMVSEGVIDDSTYTMGVRVIMDPKNCELLIDVPPSKWHGVIEDMFKRL